MTKGAETARVVAGMVDKFGEAWTLRRPGSPDVDVTVKGKRAGATSVSEVNSERRSVFDVRISHAAIAAAGWPAVAGGAPPQIKDQLLDAGGQGYIIIAVGTLYDGSDICLHVLTVSG